MKKCETCIHRIRIKIKDKPNAYICTYKKSMSETKDKCVWYESKEDED